MTPPNPYHPPMARRSSRWPGPAVERYHHDFESFRSQESTLILLNLCLLVSLMVVQLGFVEALGMPEAWMVALFGARFVMQTAELMLLRAAATAWPIRRVALYAHASITMHLAFAATVSLLSRSEDSHYTVLMVLPVVAAAFRYRLVGALAVAVFSGAISLFDVRLSGAARSLSEYFEALTMGMVFILVSVIVHVLVRQLDIEQERRHQAMEELAGTRERLVREERLGLIGRLASAVAHEIRNPIAMISSSLSAAAENDEDPELQREMFDIAGMEASRLERFTGDFLAYARAAEPQRETVHSDAALRYVAGLARAEAQNGRVALEVSGKETLALWADPCQLQQALLNLVKNAIDATPPEGRIDLECERAGESVFLHVQNQGAPIPEPVVSRLFEPFFTTKPAGTGLGLGIAQNIARAHGGDLVLSVNGPDCVRFTLSLPGAPLNPPDEG